MSYVFRGFLGRIEQIEALAAALTGVAVPLEQGFAALPGPVLEPDEAAPEGAWSAGEPFYWLIKPWEDAAVAASALGPIAYVEAEFFGGDGTQAAALWDGGQLVTGPLSNETDPAERRPSQDWPINTVLRQLGVRPLSERDEFCAVGLYRHRDVEGWIGSSPGQ